MLSEFGFFIRNYRISKGMLLYDMAKDIGVSSTFLSSCECTKCCVPKSWKTELLELYPDIDKEKLLVSIDKTNEHFERSRNNE